MPLPPQPASVLPVISGANADGPALPPTCAARSTRAAPTWLASTQALLSDVHDMVWQPVSAAGAAQAVGLWTGTWCGRPVALKLSTLESISAAVLRAHLANTSAVAAGSKVSDGGSAAACTAATAAATEAAVAMLRPLIKSAAVVHRNLMRVYDIRLAPLGEAPAGPVASSGSYTPRHLCDITIARSHLPAAPPHIITPPVHEGGLPLLQRGQAGEPRAAVAAVAATAAAGACCAPAPAADTASGLYQLAEQQTELLPTAAATLPESFKVGGTCGPGAAGTQPGEVAAGYNMNTTEVLASPGEGGIAMSSLLFSSFGKTLGPQETVVDWREAPLAAVAAATTAAAQTRSSTEVGAAAGAEARAVEARAFGKAVSMAAPQTPPANGASPAGASPAVNDGPQQQGPTAHQAVGHSMRIVEAGSPTLMDGARVAVGAAPGVTALNSVRLLPHTPPPSPPPPPLRPPGHRPSEAAEPRGCALVVVMEYCDQGDLRTMACSPSSPFRASRAWTLHAARRALLRTAREVASALATLHAAGIVHGALWPSNVLLARSSADRRGFSVRVADAGSESLAAATAANPLASTARAACMALLAPELLALGAPVSSAAADVYAFGMLLVGPVLMGVARGELRPEWPMQQHAHLAPLFAACIAHKPEQRPTFEQVHVEITSLEKQVKAERRAVLAAATAAAP
ncbi:hypothetical protein HYH02_000359 [Chlamydomonas schloesseri]|uniref:Protein kinase domain-containing protein n=1 Tax=Chlamydomonas schloesseri TaxID=2026947 RepID=A0A835WUZ9_9CHLO|nr:hypothetical protein HYH02_000359 [Chlamydomonas schloesseri]|eukprot:KAG2454512.1 hypothetical protein HYH02_000359 [Chlamydomonas schloesseri]